MLDNKYQNNIIMDDQPLTGEKSHLSVEPLRKIDWVIIILISFILSASQFLFFDYIGIIVISVVVFISYLFWEQSGRAIKLFVNASLNVAYKDANLKDKLIGFITPFIGLKFDRGKTYFIEGYTNNINLRGKGILRFIKNRFPDTISGSFGIVLILLLTFDVFNINSGGIIFFSLVLITTISPIFIFWIVPFTWTIQDIGLYELNRTSRQIDPMANKVGNSILKRFLGYAGIIGAFSYVLTNIDEIANFMDIGFNNKTSMSEKLALAGFMVLIVILMVAGIAFLISILYLYEIHPSNVNEIRKIMVENDEINLGVTSIRLASEEENNEFYSSNSNNKST